VLPNEQFPYYSGGAEAGPSGAENGTPGGKPRFPIAGLTATISAVWTDSRNNTGGGLLASATIKIDVSLPSS
jgi:hypothetical protein